MGRVDAAKALREALGSAQEAGLAHATATVFLSDDEAAQMDGLDFEAIPSDDGEIHTVARSHGFIAHIMGASWPSQ